MLLSQPEALTDSCGELPSFPASSPAERALAKALARAFPLFAANRTLFGLRQGHPVQHGALYPLGIVAAAPHAFSNAGQLQLVAAPPQPILPNSVVPWGRWRKLVRTLHKWGFARLRWPVAGRPPPAAALRRKALRLFAATEWPGAERKRRVVPHSDPTVGYEVGYAKLLHRSPGASTDYIMYRQHKAGARIWSGLLPPQEALSSTMLSQLYLAYASAAGSALAGLLSELQLAVPDQGLDSNRSWSHSYFRLYRYRRYPGAQNEVLATHADVGTLTLSGSGAAELLRPVAAKSGGYVSEELEGLRCVSWAWHRVPSGGCCVVVYAGEALAHMSGGVLWPMLHRVKLGSDVHEKLSWFGRLPGDAILNSGEGSGRGVLMRRLFSWLDRCVYNVAKRDLAPAWDDLGTGRHAGMSSQCVASLQSQSSALPAPTSVFLNLQ